MATTNSSTTPEFPRDRLSNVSSAVAGPTDVAPDTTTFLKIVRAMPLRVKMASLWLLLVVFGAIYAKLDTSWFGGALPLQDPNIQTNGFIRETGEFGTGEPIEGMSGAHWLGTDAIARDTFARIVHGSWVSLVVVVVSACCGIMIGGFLGSLVGFVRGRVETIVMATVDIILAFPALVLLLALVSIFEVRNLFVISAVIGVLSIPAYTRVARANSLAISSREFVTAARAIGTKPSRILFREVIPNVLPTLLAYTMVAAAYVVVVEGSLSFLGLSVQLPTPTWGNMINQARRDIKINVAQVIWPSLALTLTVLSLNQVGDFFQQRREIRGSNL